jgi:hypothetical protein
MYAIDLVAADCAKMRSESWSMKRKVSSTITKIMNLLTVAAFHAPDFRYGFDTAATDL